MKLSITNSKNKRFYYITESYRDQNGRSTSRTIEKVGEHSELLKTHPDPLAYAKERLAILNNGLKNEILTFNEEIDFTEKLNISENENSESTTKNIGCLYITELLKKLEVDKFFSASQGQEKFNSFDILNTLVIDRFINQSSKLAAVKNQYQYINNANIKLHDVYRFLSLLSKNNEKLQSFLHDKTKDIIKRDESVLYYDCSNFYFEIENDDLDMTTEDGILQYGFRKYFVSKEHRPNPVVQMGLFADSNGIPVAYRMDRGNFGEQGTVIPLESKLVKWDGVKKFIYCSDGGLGSYENRFYNTLNERDYVVTQSLKKTEKNELDLIFKDLNWKFVSDDSNVKLEDFKAICDKFIKGEALSDTEIKLLSKDLIYKAYPIRRSVDISRLVGKKIKGPVEMEETIFITFSAKYYFYEKNVFNKQALRAEKWIENKIEKATNPNDPSRFIKKEYITKEGEVASKEIKSFDLEQVKKESRFHGFYAVATSLDSSIKEILKINSDRWQIEYNFRLLKSSFDARPVFVSTEEHIRGHFTICYIALFLYKIIEKIVKDKDSSITASSILKTLKNMCVDNNKDKYFKSLYTDSKTLRILESFFNLNLNRKYYKNNFFKN